MPSPHLNKPICGSPFLWEERKAPHPNHFNSPLQYKRYMNTTAGAFIGRGGGGGKGANLPWALTQGGGGKLKIRGIQSEKFKSTKYKYKETMKSWSQKTC